MPSTFGLLLVCNMAIIALLPHYLISPKLISIKSVLFPEGEFDNATVQLGNFYALFAHALHLTDEDVVSSQVAACDQ